MYYICTKEIAMDSWDMFKQDNEDKFTVYDEQFLSTPISVLNNKNLNSNEKYLISLVLSYHRRDMEFYASNAYISELLGISQATISRSLKTLHDCRYINVFKKIDPTTGHMIGRTIEPIGKYFVGNTKRNNYYTYKKINYDGTDFKQTDITDINE